MEGRGRDEGGGGEWGASKRQWAAACRPSPSPPLLLPSNIHALALCLSQPAGTTTQQTRRCGGRCGACARTSRHATHGGPRLACQSMCACCQRRPATRCRLRRKATEETSRVPGSTAGGPLGRSLFLRPQRWQQRGSTGSDPPAAAAQQQRRREQGGLAANPAAAASSGGWRQTSSCGCRSQRSREGVPACCASYELDPVLCFLRHVP